MINDFASSEAKFYLFYLFAYNKYIHFLSVIYHYLSSSWITIVKRIFFNF